MPSTPVSDTILSQSPTADPSWDRRLGPILGTPAGSLVVHEIYRSIQGEGTYAGLPCVFVRLTACHLRCSYCDTPHAFVEGRVVGVDEVLRQVIELGDDLVELTGGEPLLQREAFPLLTKLAGLGKTVLLETSGAVSIAGVDPRVHVILDVKTPGSGESSRNLAENYPRLKPTDELKYVLVDRNDFDWSVEHVQRHGLLSRASVTFSPAFGLLNSTDLANWILESRLPVRVQLQLQKLLWEPNARGV